jgi:hypothetical protein
MYWQVTSDADEVDKLYELRFQHQKFAADFRQELTLAEGYSLGGTSDLTRTVERGDWQTGETRPEHRRNHTSLASPRSSEMTSQYVGQWTEVAQSVQSAWGEYSNTLWLATGQTAAASGQSLTAEAVSDVEKSHELWFLMGTDAYSDCFAMQLGR